MEHESFSSHFSQSHAISLILTFCSISVLLIYLVVSGNFILGSEAGRWTYPYFETKIPIPFWIPVCVLLLLGVFIFMGGRLIFRYEKATLFGCMLVAIAIQALIHKAYPLPMSLLIESDTSNSFYTSALQHSPIEWACPEKVDTENVLIE
jgi:hypothetical protein